MKICFRTDASVEVGSGHVMRCLTLAEELSFQSNHAFFICRDLPGNMNSLLTQKGFTVYTLPSTPKELHNWEEDAILTREVLENERIIDWLVVDHYGLGHAWEEMLKPYVGQIMVIDDLANRNHACDLLLDQNLYDDMKKRYHGLVPNTCLQLLGPKNSLLRKEFAQVRKVLRRREGKVRRILVSFGGSDPTNETFKVLKAIQMLELKNITTNVVVGAANQYSQEILTLCNQMENTIFYSDVDHMAMLIADADLAVGAGGTTTWERCCLGLPALIISVAENQEAIAKIVHRQRIGLYLGKSQDVSVEYIAEQLLRCLKNFRMIKRLSGNALKIVDGNGVLRVINKMHRGKA